VALLLIFIFQFNYLWRGAFVTSASLTNFITIQVMDTKIASALGSQGVKPAASFNVRTACLKCLRAVAIIVAFVVFYVTHRSLVASIKAWEKVEIGVHQMQNWYAQDFGVYTARVPNRDQSILLWWNSANCLTAVADIASTSPALRTRALDILANSYWNAPRANPWRQRSLGSPRARVEAASDGRLQVILPDDDTNSVHETLDNHHEMHALGAFLGDYVDDNLWWAILWAKTYEVTREHKYLDTAVEIFQDTVASYTNASCGGVWWRKQRDQENAITNELFFATAAHLANSVDNKDFYLEWAFRAGQWIIDSGLIQPSAIIVDRLDEEYCTPRRTAPTFSYNQGVILGGLVELYKAVGIDSYIDFARMIADAAIAKLTNGRGILTEDVWHERPNMGADAPTFKGVFIRNLGYLAKATGDEAYKRYILRQAQSIWANDRSGDGNNKIGNVWDHYYEQYGASGHCSGVDALVAAAIVGE
jgi:predicted alpha-1,6-mannanase (GH76 family)